MLIFHYINIDAIEVNYINLYIQYVSFYIFVIATELNNFSIFSKILKFISILFSKFGKSTIIFIMAAYPYARVSVCASVRLAARKSRLPGGGGAVS
jgi:hypothetical protein